MPDNTTLLSISLGIGCILAASMGILFSEETNRVKNKKMSSDSTTPLQQEYLVKFDFTTFDTRRSMMTGRCGSIRILSKVPKEEIDMQEVNQLCVDEMYRLKPKWNILGLDVKSISAAQSKRSKTQG